MLRLLRSLCLGSLGALRAPSVRWPLPGWCRSGLPFQVCSGLLHRSGVSLVPGGSAGRSLWAGPPSGKPPLWVPYPSPGVCAFRPWGPSARAAHRFLAPHVRLGLCHPPFPFAVGPFTCGAASARGWEPSGLGAVWALLRGVRRRCGIADPGARLDWAVV